MTNEPIPKSRIVFWCGIGFLVGCVAGAVEIPAIFPLCIAGASWWVLRNSRRCAAVILAVTTGGVCGMLYYHAHDAHDLRLEKTLRAQHTFTGTITDLPRTRSAGQSATMTVDGGGRIRIYTRDTPHLTYGARVELQGTFADTFDDSFAKHLKAERIAGTIFPKTLTVHGNDGNPIRKKLFSLQESMRTTLTNLFAHDAYAFMAAIMLGDRSALSHERTQELSTSGTLHITALSGAHIAIIAVTLHTLCLALMPRRKKLSLVISLIAIVLFVLMTGAIISAVRAASMAAIASCATLLQRRADPGKALVFAACAIAIHNPKIVYFGVGFQLSCLATAGIIFGVPALSRLRFFSTPGIAGWRTILATTLAAQIAVFPLTATIFKNFSFASIPANIAVVTILPLLTIGGFVAVGIAYLAPFAAAIVAFPLSLLLAYTDHVIGLAASAWLPFNPSFGLIPTAAYYGGCWYLIRRTMAASEAPP